MKSKLEEEEKKKRMKRVKLDYQAADNALRKQKKMRRQKRPKRRTKERGRSQGRTYEKIQGSFKSA